MPNLDLNNKGNKFKIDNEFLEFFKDSDGYTTYTNLTTKKNRLEKKSDLTKEESKFLKWINNKLNTEIQKNMGPKRSRMNIGAEGTKRGANGNNNFKNRTPNDSDNNNVGGVGDIMRITKINEEINNIKYLMDYMDKKINNYVK
jgi:hypothetical protein